MSGEGEGFATEPITPISKLLDEFEVEPTNDSWNSPMDPSLVMSDHERGSDESRDEMPETALADLLVQASSVASTSARSVTGFRTGATIQATRGDDDREGVSSGPNASQEVESRGDDQNEGTREEPSWRKYSKAFCECMYPPVVPEHPEIISLQIGNYRRYIAGFMQQLFPGLQWSMEEDRDESASDPDGNMWPVYQILVVCLKDREMIAVGEYIADLPGAYQSLGNVLRDEVILSGGPYWKDLPLSWGKVSQYSGMKCSCCKQLRPCMSSVKEWTKELGRRES